MHVLLVHKPMLYVNELIESTYSVLMNCLPDDHGNSDII